MRFAIFQDSSIGMRPNNQDRMGYAFTRECLLMIVADGLGGHFGGEIAAQLAVEVLAERFNAEAKPKLTNPAEFLRAGFMDIHREILNRTIDNNYPETPRTTAVACVVQDDHVTWAHAGDSRFYWYRNGELKQRTRDHSKLENMLSLGLLDPSDADGHPDRNKVLNCLGIDMEPVIEVSDTHPLKPGDVLLLCTDGVWAAGGDHAYGQLLKIGPLNSTLPQMIQASVRSNGRLADNATAVAMIWEGDSDSALDWSSDTTFSTIIKEPLTGAAHEHDQQPLSEEEIEQTIEEIQRAIASVHARKPMR